MASFKEIVTKAVIGKAKKTSTSKFRVTPTEAPDTVLGCWVINHTFEGHSQNGVVVIHGGFDVNVWYSYNNDTKTAVATEHFTYEDKMNIKLKDGAVLNDASEIIVRSLTQPTVTDVKVEQGVVNLSIEKELGVEREEIGFCMDAIQDPVSLQEPIYNDGAENIYIIDQIKDNKNTDELWTERMTIEGALSKLNEKERTIVTKRFFDGRTQMEVADEIGISQAQVSRLEKSAIEHIKRFYK